MPEFSIIVAMTAQRVIGYQNQLPWHLPNDLQHFKQVTLGYPILMGRKTFMSIGRPLPGRENLVLTRQPDWQADGVRVVHQLEALGAQEDAIFVIGGAEIYQQLLPRAQHLYITWVHDECVGDTWFPELDESQWQSVARDDFAADARHACAYSFEHFIRQDAL